MWSSAQACVHRCGQAVGKASPDQSACGDVVLGMASSLAGGAMGMNGFQTQRERSGTQLASAGECMPLLLLASVLPPAQLPATGFQLEPQGNGPAGGTVQVSRQAPAGLRWIWKSQRLHPVYTHTKPGSNPHGAGTWIPRICHPLLLFEVINRELDRKYMEYFLKFVGKCN